MSESAVFFLGVIALAMTVQCIFVIVAALSLRNSGARIAELCQRFDADIKPSLDDLRRVASNLRAVSESGREQAARIEALLSTTIESVETTVAGVRSLVTEPVAMLSELSAFFGGMRRGLDAERRPPRRRSPAPRRAEESDEHLFIG